LFLRALAVAGWIAWATFTISVLVEIPFALKGRRARRIPGLKTQQRIAAALVGAMFAIFAGSSLASAKVAPVQARPAVVVVQAQSAQAFQAQAALTQAQTAQATQAQAQALAPAGQQIYIVAKGDYLGRISQRFCGDFESYRQIMALNQKLVKNPNHIETGWRLVLPANAVDRGVMSHATGHLAGAVVVTPPPPAAPDPVVPSPSVRPYLPPLPSVTPSAVPSQKPPSVAPSQKPATPSQKAATPSQKPAQKADAKAEQSKEDSDVSKTLAAGAGLAAASVLAAHAVVHRRQVRQRRQPKVRRRRPAGIFLPPSQMLEDRQMAKHRAADRLDAAMRRLALGMRGRPAQDMPDVAAAWQNGGDLAIILTTECPHPPEPFEERWHNTWSLPSTVKLPESSWAPSLLPGLLTFATWPQGGELLVDGERTGLLTITGDPEGGDNLLRSLAAEAATAPWADGASILIAGFNSLDTRALVSLNPARMRAAVSVPDAISRVSKRAAANAAILAESQIQDTLLARINNMTEASWLTHLLFVADPWGEYTSALRALDEQLAGLRRVGVAVFATHPTATRWAATVSMDAGLHMGWLAVAGANARQLTSDQLAAHAESEL
jgi:hypothetical protein